METVVSGIRPTGNLHLGNYFGAVKGFLQMQNEYNCFFFIADWHSLTTHPHPDNIRNSVKTILAEYLACGIGKSDHLSSERCARNSRIVSVSEYECRDRRVDAYYFFQG